jgi:hypothetical protein
LEATISTTPSPVKIPGHVFEKRTNKDNPITLTESFSITIDGVEKEYRRKGCSSTG